MRYDISSKEVVHASNIKFTNPLNFASETVTQCSVNFGTLSPGLYSFSDNTIKFGTEGANRMDLTSARLVCSVSVRFPAGTASAPSLYSLDNNTGIYRPKTSQLSISTKWNLKI